MRTAEDAARRGAPDSRRRINEERAPGVLHALVVEGFDSAEALAHLEEDDVLALPDIKRGHQKMLIKVVKDLQDSKA